MTSGSARRPPAARVAYAVAMSSGETAPAPSPTDGTCGRRRVDPHRARQLGDAAGAEVEREPRVDGVVGRQGGARDRRPPEVRPVVGLHVPRLPLRLGPVERRGEVLRRPRVDPAAHGLGEHEGLERRARLPLAVDGEVERGAPPRHDRRERPHGAVLRVDRDDGGAGVAAPVQRPEHGLARQALHPGVDGRVHVEPTGAEDVLAVLLGQQLGDEAREVGVALAAVGGRRGEPEPAPRHLLRLRRRDRAGLGHRVEDVGAARARAVGVRERVEPRRRLRQPGEERRLGEGQLRGRLGEVRARGGLGAVGAVPERDAVEVAGQDPLLRPLAVELHRQAALRQLPRVRLLVAEVERPGQLLRDRRAALDDVALAGVRHERAGGAAVVDPLVLVEAPVLDRDDRLLQPRRHLVEPDGPVLLVRRDGRDHGAVAPADDRALPELARQQRLGIARDEEERAAGRHERGERRR